MWVVVKDGRVIFTQTTEPQDLGPGHEVFEWFGEIEVHSPAILDPETFEEIPEVPGLDPRPQGYDTDKAKFDELAGLLDAEIEFLDTTIPTIDAMNAAEVRSLVKRMAQEQRYVLRALKYAAKRWA